MKTFIKSLLTRTGEWSIKRAVALVGFLSLILVMILEKNPSTEVIDAIEYIVIAALFGTSVDHFTFRNQQNNTQNEDTNQGSQEGN